MLLYVCSPAIFMLYSWILDNYFYFFVFLFNFIYKKKFSVLKVRIIFLYVTLVVDVCRFHPIPEKFSILLKNDWDWKGEGIEIPKGLLCMRHWVRSFHNYYFIVLLWNNFIMWKQESNHAERLNIFKIKSWLLFLFKGPSFNSFLSHTLP